MPLFGSRPPSLGNWTLAERWKLADFVDNKREPMWNATTLAHKCRDNPDEFLFHYALADQALQAGLIGDAMLAALRAVEISPLDPRGSYALATVLRAIAYSGKEQHFGVSTTLSGLAKDQELPAAFSLSADDAGQQAIKAFEKTLALGVSKGDARVVRESLKIMKQQFGTRTDESDVGGRDSE